MSINETIEASLRRAEALYLSGVGSTTEILKDADKLLSKRLHAIVKEHGGARGTFTEATMLLTRSQIELTVSYLESRMVGLTQEQASKAVEVNYKRTVLLAKALERTYAGITTPLNIEAQAMQDAVTRNTLASLMQRHRSSMARYGGHLVGQFERILRVGVVSGMTNHQLVSRLVESGRLGGAKAEKLWREDPGSFPKPTSIIKERYWAERIVRTEKAFAYNAAGLRTIQTAKVVDFPDMQKKILAQHDKRTAPDSIYVHGQVREVDEMFHDGAGRDYLHPPARPNDRETVVPWRPHYEESRGTRPTPKAEIEKEIAAWKKRNGPKKKRKRRRPKVKKKGPETKVLFDN